MRLIDADAMRAEFELKARCGKDLAEENPESPFLPIYTGTVKIAEAMIEVIDATPTANNWISVKDRLPDSAGQTVIVTAVNPFNQVDVFTAFQGYGDFTWYTMETTKMADTCNKVSPKWTITHWMMMPEPAKEEAT